MSADRLKIGFIPLVDAAAPIVAATCGFAADEGLEIELVREVSWANIRDRLTFGHFDAAHLLAPLAISTSLGLGGIRASLAAPVALGLNGNAITLTPHLHEELLANLAPRANPRDPAATGAAFAAVVRARRRRGDERPTLGMTFPFSTHNYQLRLWLAAAGLDPEDDVRLAVVPPPYMVDALRSGHVEGFCVGAPWNSVAVDLGIGRILHLGVDLVRRCPEKVLAVRSAWLDEDAERTARLVRACVRAGEWLDEPGNHAEAARLLAAPHMLDVPEPLIRRALDGRLPTGPAGAEREEPDYLIFARGGAMRPDLRHASWLYGEMTRWSQAPEGQAGDAEAVYRPDLYDAAMGAAAAPEVSDPLGLFTG